MTPKSQNYSILIVDDNAAVRRSLRRVLESHPQWEVCGEAANGCEAITKAQELQPDLIVLDLSMPVMNARRREGNQGIDAGYFYFDVHGVQQFSTGESGYSGRCQRSKL